MTFVAQMLAAVSMLMTPGGTATADKFGRVTACTGSTKSPSGVWTSSCMAFTPSPRLRVRGRVWEDGSFRARLYGVTVVGCVVGKGCED